MKREQWLYDLRDLIIKQVFLPKSIEVPEGVLVSVGFPSRGALSSSRQTIGQCWRRESGGGTNQVFISPVIADSVIVGSTLVHELIHAVDDCKSGHRGPFRKMAKVVGLEGKMRSTVAGQELKLDLLSIVKRLGDYPHVGLTPQIKEKRIGTRMAHFKCPECLYPVWTTWKWVDEGFPSCPCGSGEMEVQGDR